MFIDFDIYIFQQIWIIFNVNIKQVHGYMGQCR